MNSITSGREYDTGSIHAEKRIGFGPEPVKIEGNGGVARTYGEAGSDPVEVEKGSVSGGGMGAA